MSSDSLSDMKISRQVSCVESRIQLKHKVIMFSFLFLSSRTKIEDLFGILELDWDCLNYSQDLKSGIVILTACEEEVTLVII